MDKDNVYNIYHSYNPSKRSCQPNINHLPWLARVKLNKEKMLEKGITLMDIKVKFCEQWERRYADLRGTKREKRKLIEKVTQCAILSNNDNDSVPIIHIRFDMSDYNYNTIVDFVDMFIDNFKLKVITIRLTPQIEPMFQKFGIGVAEGMPAYGGRGTHRGNPNRLRRLLETDLVSPPTILVGGQAGWQSHIRRISEAG